MKYLGIDYGKKRVGVAISDEAQLIAFPKFIFANDEKLLEKIKKICGQEKISKIILGEAPLIAKEIKAFKKNLEKEIGLPVELEKEFLTTKFSKIRSKSEKQTRMQKKKKEMVDDKAAALILQRYLDKKNK